MGESTFAVDCYFLLTIENSHDLLLVKPFGQACLVEADPCRGDDEAVGRSIEAGIDVSRSAGFAQAGSIIGQSFGNTVEAVGGLFKTCINVGRSCGSAEACTMEGEPRHGATMDDGGGIGEDGDALDGQRFDVEDTTALSLGDGGVDGAGSGNNLCETVSGVKNKVLLLFKKSIMLHCMS